MQFHLRTLVEYVAIATYLLIALATIGAPVKLLLRALGVSIGRVLPAPVVGIALVVLASWYWASPFGATKPVARVLLATCLVLTVALGAWSVRRRSAHSLLRDLDLRSCALLGAICFAGITTALVATDGQLFARSHFTVLTLGNNDAPSYALISQHLLDEGPADAGNIAGYDAGARSLGFSGGACAVLAGAASLTGLDVWQIMTPMLLVVLTLGAYALALLLREVLGREQTALAGVAAVLGFSVFYVAYLVSQWFFAQLVGMALVLSVTAVLYRGVRSRARREAVAAVGVAGLIMAAGLSVYPHMAVVGGIVLLPVVAVAHESISSLTRRVLRTALLFGTSLVLAIALAPGLLIDAIDITRELEEVAAGWPLAFVYPSEMLGFQTSTVAAKGWQTTAASVALVLGMVGSGVVAWRRGRGDAALPLTMGIFVVLGTYLVVYEREGASYRQWKWITFFIPVFVASAIALFGLAASTIRRHAATWRPLLGSVLAVYGVIILVFASGAGFPLTPPAAAYLAVTLDEINLEDDPRLDDLPSLHLNTTPYWETMWLAYFLRDQPVTLGPPSYYPPAAPVGPWYLERNDVPLVEGAEATPLNDTYRLVRMP